MSLPDAVGDGRPFQAGVEAHADPPLRTDVRRNEEVLRRRGDQRVLRAGRSVAPDRQPAVLMVIVDEHHEQPAARAERRRPPGLLLGRVREGETDAPDARQRGPSPRGRRAGRSFLHALLSG